MNESERFWENVDAPAEDACWEWTAARTRYGYGSFSVGGRNGRMHLAHRYAWRVMVGPVPVGFVLMHHCDNPPCVNPAHLSVATHAENMRDMALKHRSSSLKLSDGDVRAIRRLHAEGIPQRELARRYDTSQSNVSLITRRKSRTHVED